MTNVQQQIKIPIGLHTLHGKDRKFMKWIIKKGIKRIFPFKLFNLPEKAIATYVEIMADIIYAEIKNTSIEIIGSTIEGPSQDRIMDYLKEELRLENIENLMRKVAEEIVSRLRKTRRLSFNIAIDFTPILYYGDPTNQYVTAIKHTNGTSYAFAYCVASIVSDGVRYILYCYPVKKETDNKKFHVERAINFITKCKINISIVFLDREFYSEEVVNFLNAHVNDFKFIIPAVQTEKFRRYAKIYSTFPYRLPVVIDGWEIENSKTKEIAETTLAIIREEDEEGEHIYGFITSIPKERYRDDISIISKLYRKRWGIETLFKVEDKFNIYTTTRNGIVRYFFFVVGCILYNFWVTINFIFQIKNIDNGDFKILIKIDELKLILESVFKLKFKERINTLSYKIVLALENQ